MKLIEFGRLSHEQEAELVAGEDDPWGAAGLGIEWLPKDWHVAVCDEGGRLLAAAGLVLAEVQFGEREPIPVIGVGGVIVTASRRGTGLGARVVSEALKRAESMGPQLAMLFCRAATAGLYRKHGFAEVPGPVLADQPDGVAEMSRLGMTMWRPLKAGARLPDGTVKINGLPF